jgi:hypothetical protein
VPEDVPAPRLPDAQLAAPPLAAAPVMDTGAQIGADAARAPKPHSGGLFAGLLHHGGGANKRVLTLAGADARAGAASAMPSKTMLHLAEGVVLAAVLVGCITILHPHVPGLGGSGAPTKQAAAIKPEKHSTAPKDKGHG